MRLFIAILFTALLSCNADKQNKEPESALDAGRAFIRATLDGDFASSEELLLQDSENVQLFNSYRVFYNKLPEEKKKAYQKADYTIEKFTETPDSSVIIRFQNSYMHETDELKVVRNDGKWKVDFKYKL